MDNSNEIAANPTTYSSSDVTLEFSEAEKELESGIQNEDFRLTDAASAIKMMDLKIDAGMICNRGDNPIGSFDEAAAKAKVKLEDIDDVELLGVMDTTLACLVTWLEGHSLPQTLFTNLYLHRPQAIIDRTNKAFTISILKLVDLIRDLINRAQVFEEEDFKSKLYGVKLAPEVSFKKASSMLQEVEEDLKKRIEALKEVDVEDSKMQVCVGLHARIRWLRFILMSLLELNKKESISVVHTRKCLKYCQENGLIIPKSIPYGLQADELSDMPGFDPLFSQRLLTTPSFPLNVKIKSRNEAVQYLSTLNKNLLHICDVKSCSQFHSALEFFLEFSRSRPCVLSRSLLQLLYVPVYKRSCIELVRERVRSFVASPALVPGSPLCKPPAQKIVDKFLSHCSKRCLTYIQICGHNRSRQSDKLVALLKDFANLQDEADEVDSFLHNIMMSSEDPKPHLACFSTWTLYFTVRVMIHYLLSGFEFDPDSLLECQYIYWYLFEFLYAWLISALSRAEMLSSEAHTQKGKAAKKNAKKKKPFEKEIVTARALQSLCGGYFAVVMALRVDKFIESPQVDQDSEKARYEHRFVAFEPITMPPAIDYQQFNEAITNGKRFTSTHHYFCAAKYFHQAKDLLLGVLNRNQEAEALLKISKHNVIVANLLASSAGEGFQNCPVQMDFTEHSNFPIFVLQRNNV